jgi:hypothetical protein
MARLPALPAIPRRRIAVTRLARYLIDLDMCFAPKKLLLSSGYRIQVEV